MDWNAQIEGRLRMLDRIVVILLALAALAARAAGAPRPIRYVVSWFLRRAETVAAEFVASPTGGAVHGNWLSVRLFASDCHDPADELNLALSLSRLARVVATLVSQLRRLAFLHRGERSGRKNLGRGPRRRVRGAFSLTVTRVARPDTS